MPQQVVLKIDQLGDTELAQKADEIGASAAATAAYAAMTPTPAQITAAAAAFSGKITTAKNLAQQAGAAVLAKDQYRPTLIALLNKAARWTEDNVTSAEDVEAVFELKSPATPTTSVPKVENLATTFGESAGQVKAKCKRVAVAKSYEYQCNLTPNNDAGWRHHLTTTKTRCVLEGLPSGVRIQIRVRAIGPNGLKGPWSDIAEQMVP